MKILTSLMTATLLLSFYPTSAQETDDLTARYTDAVREARQQHTQREEQLLEMYRSHLDRLIAAAQPQGDIESIVVYLDEKETPGEGEAHALLRTPRESLRQQRERLQQQYRDDRLRIERQYEAALDRQIQAYTRSGDIDAAVATSDTLQEVRERIAQLEPRSDSTEAAPEPDVRLGPEVLADGNLDDANEDHWRFSAPGGRNRTGFHTESRQEAGGQRNKVLRFQQDERRGLGVHRGVSLRPNQEYLLSWRHRLQSPWSQGIELRGKGHYYIGVRIPPATYRNFPLAQQQRFRPHARARINPPNSTEWVQMERRIRTGPHMNQLFISVSSGEGDFLIDDISIRPILPPE